MSKIPAEGAEGDAKLRIAAHYIRLECDDIEDHLALSAHETVERLLGRA